MVMRTINILKLFMALSVTWLTLTGIYFAIEWRVGKDSKFIGNYILQTPGCSMKRYTLLKTYEIEEANKSATDKECPISLVHISLDGMFIIQNLDNNFIQQGYEICGDWADTYCIYVPFKRLKDNRYIYGHSVKYYANVKYIPLKLNTEFLKVKCFDSKHHQFYQERLFVVQHQFSTKWKESKNSQIPLSKASVLILALDGVSRDNADILLPLTMKFLRAQKYSFDFIGYSSLGDDYQSNILPIVMGQMNTENTTAQLKSDFVWKTFHEHGYTTIFGENSATKSLLYSHSNQFRTQFTDYYFNPFMRETFEPNQFKGIHKNFPNECRAQQILDLMTYFLPFYKKQNFFSLYWLSSAQILYLTTDEALRNTLRAFKIEKILYNTFVFVVSNPPLKNEIHVFNEGRMREMRVVRAQQPILFALLPVNFEMHFPLSTVYFNLNTKRLVTPLDLHDTILNILDYNKVECNKREDYLNIDLRPNAEKKISMSLFCSLSKWRTCEEANIAENFCPCDE